MSESSPKRHYMGRESIPVTHHFTPDELRGFAQEMSHAQEEAETLTTEKKHIADSYKERIDKEVARVSNAAKKYRDGKETVYVYCNKVADYATGEILWTDPDTGEVVQRRRMTDEERQVPLFATAEPAPQDEDDGQDIPFATEVPGESVHAQ